MRNHTDLSEAALLDFTPNLDYPLSLSGVYALGVSVENMILKGLLHLMKRRTDFQSQKLLNQLFSYQMKEAEILKKHHSYELNIEVGHFYESGGIIIATLLSSEDLHTNLKLINQTLTYFTREAEQIIDEAHSLEDLLNGCFKLRTEAADLFHHLALLYPEGAMRNSLEDISQFIYQRNVDLTEAYGKIA
ncbi:MAG: hypothetical protein U9N81_13295 [Bacillota bacterium]|nr:hypothetical protein [Bacillota bacterium]